jgi:hypothetical protein
MRIEKGNVAREEAIRFYATYDCRKKKRDPNLGPPRLHENHAELVVSDYSYRSATMGSTLAARRAGT